MGLIRYCIGSIVLALSVSAFAQHSVRLSPRSHGMLLAPKAVVDKEVAVYLTIDENTLDYSALKGLDVNISVIAGNIATAKIPVSKLTRLSEVTGIKYVQVASPVASMLDLARPETGADLVANGTSLSQPYTGKGVVVGIVDAGFDYTHAAFYDKNHNLRIKRVWEQSGKPFGDYKAPEKFGYGIELNTVAGIEDAEGDIRNNSHGTHVANIAAGSDDYMNGAFRGVVHDADIVLVSMGEASQDNVNISNALRYIFDYADEVYKPCVINLSLGDHSGPHDGTSTFDVIADELQGKGRLIVGSAGNHRKDKFHLSHVFSSENDAPLKSFVLFKNDIDANNPGGDIEIWGEKGFDFEVSLVSYKTTTHEENERVLVYPSSEAVQTVGLGRYITGTVTVASEISPLNGKPHLVITSGLKSIRTNYAFALEIKPKGNGQVDIWADNVKLGLESKGIEGFSGPVNESTIAEIGGTAKRILTVGAYTTRNEYTLINQTAVNTLDETVGALSSFSSCGPTADGRMKPEITAPGCFIISAVSSNDGTMGAYIAAAHEDNGRQNIYGYMQGTSMSAPMVTGIVATWLEAYPELTPETLKEVVKKTARKDEYTGELLAEDYNWGYGKIDAYAGIKECIEISTSGCVAIDAPFNGAITMRGEYIDVSFLADTSHASVKIYSAGGTMMFNNELSNVAAGSNVSVSTEMLPAGMYILQVQTGAGVKVVKFNK